MSTTQNQRIIIIDDNPAIHQDFRKILQVSRKSDSIKKMQKIIFNQDKEHFLEFEFEIDSAFQGEEGCQMIRKSLANGKPYAIAFVDVRMPPGWDGIETIEKIWQLDTQIQIVICTAYSDFSWEEIIKKLGQTDRLLILKKPFDSMEIRQLALTLCKKWILNQQLQERIDHFISQNKHMSEKIAYQNTHDSVTGLPNRALLIDRMRQAILQAQHQENILAVLFIALERFKIIAETYGHEASDSVLQEIAKRLLNCVREDDTVSRISGNEFVILLSPIIKKEDSEECIKKIISSIKKPLMINAQEFHINCNIGVSFYPNHGHDITKLLKNADIALTKSCKAGQGQWMVYSEDMEKEIKSRLTLEADLIKALEKNEFVLYYQPLVELQSYRIIGVEALIRWQHPQLGLISPNEFLPIAEDLGIINAIGEWVIRTACTQSKTWKAAGLPSLKIAVNVSPEQLKDKHLVKKIQNILTETDFDPSCLEIEITENSILMHLDEIINSMQQLKELGIGFAIDDFGTGYSNLNYLKQFPIDTIKIDKSFIQNIATDIYEESIVQAIIDIAKSLKLHVVAEGVETKEQLELLMKNGSHEIQGYYISAPVTADQIPDLLEKKIFQEFN